MDKSKKINRVRRLVQIFSGIVYNLHLPGFITGRIYQGPLKKFCVPGMNCYACPAAIMSCPIGAMQAVLGQRKAKFAFYVIGFISVLGILVGRFICGWLCLFGLIQELLYSIPVPKLKVKNQIDKALRFTKYFFLFGLCIFVVSFLRDRFGISTPYFCKYICPVGMLEGGIPLLLVNKAMRSAAGYLYLWKFIMLTLIIILSMVINRPFCKYICPLGAFYSLFQKVSFLKIKINSELCVNCGTCRKTCRMQVNPAINPNSLECIRCGECIEKCPEGALSFKIN